MEVNESTVHRSTVWADSGPIAAVRQISEFCRQVTSIDLQVAPEGASFYPVNAPVNAQKDQTTQQGILSIQGKLVEDSIILVKVELVKVKEAENLRVPSASFFKHLSNLKGKTRLLPPQAHTSRHISLCVELKVNAAAMSMARSSAFIDELRHLNELAKLLQAELPAGQVDVDLIKVYKEFTEILTPINPWQGDSTEPMDNFLEWAKESSDFLLGSSCLAIASPFPIMQDFALAVLSWACRDAASKSLGQLLHPAINARRLVELTRKAPGVVVVPAVRMRMGTSPYELGNEMKALLSTLSQANTPAIFTGSHGELQAIFHGGQGGDNDPLFPILRHIPEVPMEILTQFTIRCKGQLYGGLSPVAEEELAKKTFDALKDLNPAEQKRILPMAAKRALTMWASGKKMSSSSTAFFASKLIHLSESLAGLASKPRVSRTPSVQEHFTEILTSPDLLSFFKEHLLAQDNALEQLSSRLRMESLTRPLHQPIRCCAQGTPATGKSESASLLAQRLDIPYINIDAASMPDYHTAAAQLLGSGRGIVGSHQSGRLEQAAKHHTGVVVEVSDLDHAPPNVRAALADLFLQVLETGEAQSATGAMFSCANLIFAFTMNLPGGLDEEVHKGVGFNNIPSHHEIRKRVSAEIKNMLSSAFLSRVGTPILFEPLTGNALSAVVERAVKKAIFNAAARLNFPIKDILLDNNVGARIISSMDTNLKSFGARALLEEGRSVAAEALINIQQNDSSLSGKSLVITINSKGKLIIKPLSQ